MQKALVATVTSNRIPLYDISPKDLLQLTAHLVRDKRDAMFLSFGARCSSERTEKRQVKKILDRGGNIKITKSDALVNYHSNGEWTPEDAFPNEHGNISLLC